MMIFPQNKLKFAELQYIYRKGVRNMIGIDISNYQKGIDFTKDNFDFCIVKVTEGVGFTDKSFRSHVYQLTKLNKLIGCYHFARPDLHPTIQGMKSEAEYFVSKVEEERLIGNAILVLDWEREPFDKEELIAAWLSKVVELTGVVPFIYGSRSKLTTTSFKNLIMTWPVWMAVWPSIEKLDFSTAGEFISKHKPSKDKVDWKIWQFSSTGKLKGFSGNVDLDYADISEFEWRRYAWSPYAEQKEKISDDMQWCIDNGIFVGYGNGLYGPKDPLTREQAATLIRMLLSRCLK